MMNKHILILRDLSRILEKLTIVYVKVSTITSSLYDM